MDKIKTCCFSGHRQICDEHLIRLPECLTVLLDSLIKKGFRHFKTGGAIGFDTIAALKCLELKNKYPDLSVTLELCLPCRDQTLGWSEMEKSAYRFILQRADKVSYESDVYTKGCMHARNRRLVNGSDVCVCYLSTDKGGTAYTCSYAKEKGVEVINLYERLI
ncbi:MAG: DUF1273 family protein [Clostridia bacterium]|nr:DUF1273 family protein [Clostridia bacterium]